MDALTIIGLLFAIAFSSLILTYFMDKVNIEFQGDSSIPQMSKDILARGRTQLPGLFDWWFALFLVALPLASAALAYFNNIHPVMFWISMPLIMVAIFLGAAYSEVWQAAMQEPELSVYASELPIQNLVLTNYGKYSLFIVLVVALGTFVKLRGGYQRDVYGGF